MIQRQSFRIEILMIEKILRWFIILEKIIY